jgi:outer membrane protein TolC
MASCVSKRILLGVSCLCLITAGVISAVPYAVAQQPQPPTQPTQAQPTQMAGTNQSSSTKQIPKIKSPGLTPLGMDADALRNATQRAESFESTLHSQTPQLDISGQTAPTTPPPNAGQKQGTGEAVTPSNLPSGARTQDQNRINEFQEYFRSNFLVGEAIQLALPKPSELLSLGGKLPPIRLEASYTEPVSLKDVLRYAVDNNLTIRIAQTTIDSNKWLTVAAYGNFLPNILMSYQQQYLSGSSFLGGVTPVTFGTPNVSTSAGYQFYGFQGGRVVFNLLAQMAVWRAAKHALHGSLNDVLLNTAIGYFNLMRNQALLQIQTRAVEVSKAQVLLNQQLERAGTGTKFQVLQSQTQLATDEQNLLNQQVALRSSSIDLAAVLNLNQGVNLLSVEQEVKKIRLIDPRLEINDLINIAVLNRPELKQFEQLRIAARRNIQVAASQLYPNLQFYGSEAGNGPTLSKTYQLVPGSFETVAIQPQLTNISPVFLPTTTGAPNLAAFSIAAGEPALSTAQVYIPPTIESRQIRKSYTIGYAVGWNYNNAGIPQLATTLSNRALSRQALLNSNNQLITVTQQVRETYLTSVTAERQIEVTTKAVISAAEELRLATVRLQNGVGTNLDVINAQRDFTTALINKADAIIQFNIAQCQLLHDIGLVTVDNLTSGHLVGRQG